ncbi:MAG: hypothetical protein Q8P63_01620 [Candidatus Nealsonbacteria bacterium]|nr:hypothetical protein [Candidatus Nealsonbacteria bacterium]
MVKKIVFLVIVLVLVGGGFFYWQNSQADVKDLNKMLPDGVKVVKSLISGEYKVVNKIDGYEFKVPEERGGLSDIEYIPKRIESDYTVATIELEALEGDARIVIINRFKLEETDLEPWAKINFDTFSLVGDFSKDTIKEFNIVKTQENVHLGGMYIYFFKTDDAIYAITGGSEDFIRYIIANGKW